MEWLIFGCISIYIKNIDIELPWPWPMFYARSPGVSRWRIALTFAHDANAGEDGSLRRDEEEWNGPGFSMICNGSKSYDGRSFLARVQTPVACMGALAAALIAQESEHSWVLVHGALISVGSRGMLILGQSGAGKSSLSRRLGRRVLGSNAALLWQQAGAIWAIPLPITGHGDAAVAMRSVRLVGAWSLEGGDVACGSASAVARWLSAIAGAKGNPPAVEWAWRLAQAVPVHAARQQAVRWL